MRWQKEDKTAGMTWDYFMLKVTQGCLKEMETASLERASVPLLCQRHCIH